MYETILTMMNMSKSDNNLRQQAYTNVFGIVWDDNRHLNNNRMTEQPVMNGCNTSIVSTDVKDNDIKKNIENKKITVYMDKSLLDHITELKKNGYIRTFSQLTSDAINEYILIFYYIKLQCVCRLYFYDNNPCSPLYNNACLILIIYHRKKTFVNTFTSF